MDAEYLKRNIGEVLADGLAACVVQSPEDPIDFLSQFLLNFARNKNRGEGQRHRALRIQQLQVASEARQSERAAVRAAKSQSRSLRIRAEQDFVDAATTLIWPIEVVHEFVKLLGLVLGATGVYAGIVEDRDGQKSIRYFTATLGHEFMIGERLQPPAVTLSLLDPEAHSEPGTQNDESEPKPPVPYRPRSVHIANTVLGDNPQKLRFFRQKDVGSYGAILIEYETLLHEAAFALEDGKYRLGPKPAQPEPGGNEPEQAAESDPTGSAPPEPELVVEAPRIPTHVLIAFDTIGQCREISTAEFNEAIRLSLTLREQMQKADLRAFQAEREWRKTIAKFSSSEPKPGEGSAATATENH